jgi:uncharacterized protein YqhQ
VTAEHDRDRPVRLGGMALGNGVLVHGPRHWSCAIRMQDGSLRVASGEKSLRSVDVGTPVLRGPARVAEIIAVFPALRRALPEAELPFLDPGALSAMLGATLAARSLRRSRLGVGVQETLGALFALVPAAAVLRGTEVAAYHGAEHISIGSYEHGEPRPREHERCGSHMLGPLLATTVAGNVAASRLGKTPRARALARIGVGLGSMAAATEIFGWMLRNPRHPVSRALAWPGRELQTRLLTDEPTPAQLEVAEAALAECLRLERADLAD